MRRPLRKTALGSILFAGALLALAVTVEAQQANAIPRIGHLAVGSASSASSNLEAFGSGLRDFGYIDGKNIRIESRYADGKRDRLPSLVAELMHLKVDAFITGTLIGIRAITQATTTIPIVMVLSVDPVATGLVDNLAHPDGNITGVTSLARELSGKRLELLKEVGPGIHTSDYLWIEAIHRQLSVLRSMRLWRTY